MRYRVPVSVSSSIPLALNPIMGMQNFGRVLDFQFDIVTPPTEMMGVWLLLVNQNSFSPLGESWRWGCHAVDGNELGLLSSSGNHLLLKDTKSHEREERRGELA